MAFQKGEIYRCPEPSCGCEIEVTKGATASCNGKAKPHCCCGREMVKQ